MKRFVFNSYRSIVNASSKPILDTNRLSTPTRSFRTTVYRFSNGKRSPRDQEYPGFKKIFIASIVGTGIFVLAVKKMNRVQPKTDYTEAEYANVMKGLKRRIASFQPGEIELNLYLSDVKIPKEKQPPGSVTIVPSEVVEYYRNEADGAYEAYLNELYSLHNQGSTDEKNLNYINFLPSGTLISLLGKYMNMKVNKGDTVNIVDFPMSMKDAFQLENEIGIINHIYVSKGQGESDICKYFQTVNKVIII